MIALTVLIFLLCMLIATACGWTWGYYKGIAGADEMASIAAAIARQGVREEYARDLRAIRVDADAKLDAILRDPHGRFLKRGDA
jgi:hypothetical protein